VDRSAGCSLQVGAHAATATAEATAAAKVAAAGAAPARGTAVLAAELNAPAVCAYGVHRVGARGLEQGARAPALNHSPPSAHEQRAGFA